VIDSYPSIEKGNLSLWSPNIQDKGHESDDTDGMLGLFHSYEFFIT